MSKNAVLEAMNQNGNALQCTSRKFKADNKEVVLEAVKQNGHALQYASKDLKADKEVVLKAVKK